MRSITGKSAQMERVLQSSLCDCLLVGGYTQGDTHTRRSSHWRVCAVASLGP